MLAWKLRCSGSASLRSLCGRSRLQRVWTRSSKALSFWKRMSRTQLRSCSSSNRLLFNRRSWSYSNCWPPKVPFWLHLCQSWCYRASCSPMRSRHFLRRPGPDLWVNPRWLLHAASLCCRNSLSKRLLLPVVGAILATSLSKGHIRRSSRARISSCMYSMHRWQDL